MGQLAAANSQDAAKRMIAHLRVWLTDSSVEAETQRAAVIGILARCVNAGLALVTQIIFARFMGVGGYGVYALVSTWLLVLAHLATCGLSLMPQRFWPDYEAKQDMARLKGLYRFAGVAPLATGCVLMAVAAALFNGSQVLQLSFGASANAAHIPLMIGLVALPALAMIDVLEGIALAKGWNMLGYGLSFVIRPLLFLVLAIIGLVNAGDQSLAVIMLAFSGTAWIAALLLAISLRQKLKASSLKDGRSTTPVYEFQNWLRLAGATLLADGAFMSMSYADILILGATTSGADIGIYAAATKLISVVAFVQFGLAWAAAHHLSRFNATGNNAALGVYMRKTAGWTFWPSLIIAGFVMLLAAPLLELFGRDFATGAPLVMLLLAGLVVRALIGPSEQLLMMTNAQNSCLAIYAAAAGVNIVLSLALAPRLGAQGVAFATMIATIFCAALTAITVRRHLGVWPLPALPFQKAKTP